MIPVTYAGRAYRSIAALATRYGLSPEAAKRRLQHGWPLEVRRLQTPERFRTSAYGTGPKAMR